jgi:hypothetical protein
VTCSEGVDLDLTLDGSVRDHHPHHQQPPTRTPYCCENETTTCQPEEASPIRIVVDDDPREDAYSHECTVDYPTILVMHYWKEAPSWLHRLLQHPTALAVQTHQSASGLTL